ncbi:hypothetical protein [Streptomyces sp. NPDC048340]
MPGRRDSTDSTAMDIRTWPALRSTMRLMSSGPSSWLRSAKGLISRS